MKSTLAVIAAFTVLAPALSAGAVGGNDTNTSTKVDAETARCQRAIASASRKYTSKRSDAIGRCLDAILKCDEKRDAEQARRCRESLLMPSSGQCAVGSLDSGISTLGAGASQSALAGGSRAKLDRALVSLRRTVASRCFEPGVWLSGVQRGLGFDSQISNVDDLVDALNADPAGVGCMANSIVRRNHPAFREIIAAVSALDGQDCWFGTCEMAGVLKEAQFDGLQSCAASVPPSVSREVPVVCDSSAYAGYTGGMELTVTPKSPVSPGASFVVEIGGTLRLSRIIMQYIAWTTSVPQANGINSAQGTVVVRSGATGAPVVLQSTVPLPAQFDVPWGGDCAGTDGSPCPDYELEIPLEPIEATFVADDSGGPVLFGWYEVAASGSFQIPPADYFVDTPTYVRAAGLPIIQPCYGGVMGSSGGNMANDDSDLIAIPIE